MVMYVNNDYCQRYSRVLYTSVQYKSFGQFLDISPKNFIFLETFNPGLLYIEVCFTDQNSKLLEVEDKINITLTKLYSIKQMHYSVDSKDRIFIKCYQFLSFAKKKWVEILVKS